VNGTLYGHRIDWEGPDIQRTAGRNSKGIASIVAAIAVRLIGNAKMKKRRLIVWSSTVKFDALHRSII